MSNTFAKGWLVADPKGLSSLIRDIVETKHGGVVLRAAQRQAGVGRVGPRKLGLLKRREVQRWCKLIRRFSTTPARRRRDETYQHLARLVPRSRHAELRATLFDESTERAYGIYEKWLRERREASSALMVPRSLVPTDLRLEEESVGELRVQDLIGRIRRRFPDLCESFDTFLTGHSMKRADQAWRDIVTPLLHHAASGCVEVDWKELTDGELNRFVKYGIELQKILLKRSNDLRRAQEAPEGPLLVQMETHRYLLTECGSFDPRAWYSRKSLRDLVHYQGPDPGEDNS